MPDRNLLQRAAIDAFHRWPAMERLTLGLLDRFYQLALLPFRRPRVNGVASEQPDLVARTSVYNEAAEQYFATFEHPDFLLDKPFSETSLVANHFFDVGVLIDALRVRPGDTVVEIGAGSCWLSHMLNRYGCRTIALDVSSSALSLGRQLFESDSRTNWGLTPEFLTYDGHRIPLDTGTCDGVVINDAFHHIPNQRELLAEMYRILTPGGLVAMSEPGRGHATADHSVAETARGGVLENELVLADLAALAQACGFQRVNVIVTNARVRREIPAHELGAFMGGKGFAGYWKSVCSALEQHHYIVCYKDDARVTTRRPSRLSARLDVTGANAVHVAAGQSPRIVLRITNIGDTRWLASAGEGWTRIGGHLYRDGANARRRTVAPSAPPGLLDFDWFRADLPGDVEPGKQVSLTLEFPPIQQAGAYLVVLDLVVEGLGWFADRGSQSARVLVEVLDNGGVFV